MKPRRYTNVSTCSRAGIDPRLAAGKLSRPRCERLAQEVRGVLAQAIEAGGQKPGQDVLVFSSSCTKDGIQAVRDGKLFATVDNGPIKIAEAASKIVVQVLRGERTPKTVYTPSQVVTKENVEQHAASCTF